MAWVEFSADHDWRPTGGFTIAYKAGMRCAVTRACAAEAVGLGKAREIEPPPADHAIALKADPYWRPSPLNGEEETGDAA